MSQLSGTVPPMKENVLDVLMYLPQGSSTENDAQVEDQEQLISLLSDAGFGNDEIHKAFDWLKELDHQIARQHKITPSGNATTRCFAPYEESILDLACRSYLLGLYNTGILSTNNFELVIDRVLSLSVRDISLDQLEWLVLVVLTNQSDEKAVLYRLEAMLFRQDNTALH